MGDNEYKSIVRALQLLCCTNEEKTKPLDRITR